MTFARSIFSLSLATVVVIWWDQMPDVPLNSGRWMVRAALAFLFLLFQWLPLLVEAAQRAQDAAEL